MARRGLSAGGRALTLQSHGAVLELARQEQCTTASINPGLVPKAILTVEEVQALSRPALRARPVFEQRAAIEYGFDPVVARQLAMFGHAPMTHPEVELPRRAVLAAGPEWFLGAHGSGATGQ